MMTSLARLLSVAVAVAVPTVAHASDPVGVYALVEKVTSPGKDQFKIDGWFSIADSGWGMGGSYAAPAHGFVYYQCPQGMSATCAMEWTDIGKSIGSGSCVAYGSRGLWPSPGNGTVRATGAAVLNPDPYPIQMGVSSTQFGQCNGLLAAANGGSVDAGAPADLATAPSPDLATAPRTDGAVLSPDLAMPVLTKAAGCSVAGGRGGGLAPALLGLALLALALRRRGSR